MKMKIKSIIAALLAASVISTSVFAYTPFLPEELETEEAGDEAVSEKEEDTKTEENAGGNTSVLPEDTMSAIRPADLTYQYFSQILDAYLEYHLYEFTREEVIEKFFKDFLTQNPMYLELFSDYLLGTMDPYSAYHRKSSNFLTVDNTSKGFGFIITNDSDEVSISEVIEGSAAELEGFLAGDKFVSIAGINVEGLSYDAVTVLLSEFELFIEQPAQDAETSAGEQPSSPEPLKCPITIERNGEKIDFLIAKAPMTDPQVVGMIDENHGYPTGYVKVLSFLGKGTVEKFEETVRKFAEDGIKYLTVDLRNNGGGDLTYAIRMAELFIQSGELLCYYDDRNLEEPNPVYSTTENPVKFDSITFLVNEHSASASELMTSILRDHGLIKLVGTKTFGKSLGQSVFSLFNGDTVTITSYQMLDKNLGSYDGIGLIPDLAIEEVEMCYTLPPQLIFNHQNYVEIAKNEGVYNEVTKALEDRLVIMGFLREEYCDGIFDDVTKRSLYILQKHAKLEATGYVTYELVSYITRVINSFKTYIYEDNTQYEVAMIVHRSFSQGKRLVAEKERLREQQSKLIAERDEALEKAAG